MSSRSLFGKLLNAGKKPDDPAGPDSAGRGSDRPVSPSPAPAPEEGAGQPAAKEVQAPAATDVKAPAAKDVQAPAAKPPQEPEVEPTLEETTEPQGAFASSIVVEPPSEYPAGEDLLDDEEAVLDPALDFDLSEYLSDGLPAEEVDVVPSLAEVEVWARSDADAVVVVPGSESPSASGDGYGTNTSFPLTAEESLFDIDEPLFDIDEPLFGGEEGVANGGAFGEEEDLFRLAQEEIERLGGVVPGGGSIDEDIRKDAELTATPPTPPTPLDASVREMIAADAELRGISDRVVMRMLQKRSATPPQVKSALREKKKHKLTATLWRILAQQPGVEREEVYREAAHTYAFSTANLEEGRVDLEFARKVAGAFSEERRNRMIELRLLPIGYDFEPQSRMLRMIFITHDPGLPAVREFVQGLKLERFLLQYASETKVKALIAEAFPKKNEYLERMSEDPLAYDLGSSYEEEADLVDEEALEAEISRSSLINLFEATLVEAVRQGVSDIHIYPNERRQVEIHFRLDGRLQLWHVEEKINPESMLAVIKDNSTNVDRFERDAAQDGFIQRRIDDALIRFRVSILPIATAVQDIRSESIVIRVLDDRKVLTDLKKLGLLEGSLKRFDQAIRQPHGMVILTGPTGSGKSTTLVAALHQVVTPEVNVLTVEDPVEYIIRGVRQIKLNHKLGLEQAIRAILRHDPDIVMVGEMRDRPTAELAIKLANTGHLTFSTLHTNDAPSAVSRLYKMGVEPFLIAYAINLVVAQRLIRRLCPDCKQVDDDPDPVLLDNLGFEKKDLTELVFYKPGDDPQCKTCRGVGYKGRRAVTETLYFSRAIRHLIVEADKSIDEDAIRQLAQKEGMLSLQDSAREHVKMGDTSIDEMMRVTMSDH